MNYTPQFGALPIMAHLHTCAKSVQLFIAFLSIIV